MEKMSKGLAKVLKDIFSPHKPYKGKEVQTYFHWRDIWAAIDKYTKRDKTCCMEFVKANKQKMAEEDTVLCPICKSILKLRL